VITSIFFENNLWLKAFLCLTSSYFFGFFSIKKYIKIMNEKALYQPIRHRHQISRRNACALALLAGYFSS
jgi:hypothetical protein